ncbi:MAG: hypothetical protein IPO90_09865 [Flavobacteriales bacterium]|nr:hypothetical protein [Flavobacteriales bacterium]MBL0044521.1 hypothetical protein [Flavobacteriales bacterium]
MSENPFKIIRSTDQPPESLRKEVVSSVKFLMLMMRFVQLFVADFSLALFDKVRKADGGDAAQTKPRK